MSVNPFEASRKHQEDLRRAPAALQRYRLAVQQGKIEPCCGSAMPPLVLKGQRLERVAQRREMHARRQANARAARRIAEGR